MDTNIKQLKYEFDIIRQNMIDLRDVKYSLWNSLITFNGILIGAFAVIASLKPDNACLIHPIIFLIITLFTIFLLVINFKYTHDKLEVDIKKALNIFRLKVKLLKNSNAYKETKNDKAEQTHTHKITANFLEKYSSNLAFILTFISTIYLWVTVFYVFN